MGREIKTREDFICSYLKILLCSGCQQNQRHILFVEGRTDKNVCLKIFNHFSPTLEFSNNKDIIYESYSAAYNKINNDYKKKLKEKNKTETDILVHQEVKQELNANCKFVIKSIEYLSGSDDYLLFDVFGFIDHDYGEHEEDIKDLEYIKETSEHDLEMNLIRCYMPKYMKEIKEVDDQWHKTAISDFIFCLKYCIYLNFLQSTYFKYNEKFKPEESISKELYKKLIYVYKTDYLFDNKNNDLLKEIENTRRSNVLLTDLPSDADVSEYFRDYISDVGDELGCLEELNKIYEDIVSSYNSIYDEKLDELIEKRLKFGDENLSPNEINKNLSPDENIKLQALLRLPVGHGFIQCLLILAICSCEDNINHYYNLENRNFIGEDHFREKLLDFACEDINALSKIEPYKSYAKFRDKI